MPRILFRTLSKSYAFGFTKKRDKHDRRDDRASVKPKANLGVRLENRKRTPDASNANGDFLVWNRAGDGLLSHCDGGFRDRIRDFYKWNDSAKCSDDFRGDSLRSDQFSCRCDLWDGDGDSSLSVVAGNRLDFRRHYFGARSEWGFWWFDWFFVFYRWRFVFYLSVGR